MMILLIIEVDYKYIVVWKPSELISKKKYGRIGYHSLPFHQTTEFQ